MEQEIKVACTEFDMREFINDRIRNGDVRLELHGLHELNESHEFGFLLDKSRYTVRFAEETEETVKVLIEPKR